MQKNRVCKLPVAEQVEKLISGFMAYAMDDESKYGIGKIIKVRKYRKKH